MNGVDSFIDEGTFSELDRELASVNPLGFPDYLEKLDKDRQKTDLNEAVLTGSGKVNGNEIVLAIMDSRFRMGSMGSVVGEKITRAVEEADRRKVPFHHFHGFRWSKDAGRGPFLMQMAKTSVALKRFSDNAGSSSPS